MVNVLILAAETGIDMAEVLRDTHAFYEGAWSKLVWTLVQLAKSSDTGSMRSVPMLLAWN